MKYRLGSVGPGIEENQWSQTTNSRASAFNTGSWSGLKHFITSPAGREAALLRVIRHEAGVVDRRVRIAELGRPGRIRPAQLLKDVHEARDLDLDPSRRGRPRRRTGLPPKLFDSVPFSPSMVVGRPVVASVPSMPGEPEHMVERPILEHQHEDVFDAVTEADSQK